MANVIGFDPNLKNVDQPKEKVRRLANKGGKRQIGIKTAEKEILQNN